MIAATRRFIVLFLPVICAGCQPAGLQTGADGTGSISAAADKNDADANMAADLNLSDYSKALANLRFCDPASATAPLEYCGWPGRFQTSGAVFTSTAMAASVEGATVQPFLPWPPPNATHFIRLGKQVPIAGKFGDTALALEKRLNSRGYDRLLYFAVEGGFAMATQVERFGENGIPIPRGRFITHKIGGWTSLPDYARRLVSGERGHFRLFVFIVTNRRFAPAPYEISQSDIDRWKRTGVTALPYEIAQKRTPRATTTSLLIYELEGGAGKSAALVAQDTPAGESAHLSWLGFKK